MIEDKYDFWRQAHVVVLVKIEVGSPEGVVPGEIVATPVLGLCRPDSPKWDEEWAEWGRWMREAYRRYLASLASGGDPESKQDSKVVFSPNVEGGPYDVYPDKEDLCR